MTYSKALTTGSLVPVALVASSLSHQPPLPTTNAPARSMPGESTSPVWSAVVSVSATVANSSRFVGMSASVSPAASQEAVLICNARVEKSLGAHHCVSSYVKASRSDS